MNTLFGRLAAGPVVLARGGEEESGSGEDGGGPVGCPRGRGRPCWPDAGFARAAHRFYSAFVTEANAAPEPVFTAHDNVAVMLSAANTFETVEATPSLVFDTEGRGCIWGTAPVTGRNVHRFIRKVGSEAVERTVRSALGGLQRPSSRKPHGAAPGPWS